MLKSSFKTIVGAGSMLAIAVAMSPLDANAQSAKEKHNQNQQQQKQIDRNHDQARAMADQQETEKVTGQIIDLYSYMQDSNRQDQDKSADQSDARYQQGAHADRQANANQNHNDRAQQKDQHPDRALGMNDKNHQDMQNRKHESVAENAPIAIEAEGSGLANLVPGQSAYVILFNPDDQASKKAYQKAREMVGQKVTIEGKMQEKGGLKALLVQNVKAAQPDTAKTTTD